MRRTSGFLGFLPSTFTCCCVAVAVVVVVASLAASHALVEDLSKEEQAKMEIWARALDALNTADETTDVSLILEVLQGNNTIPVIVLDRDHEVMDYRNVTIHAATYEDSLKVLASEGERMYEHGRSIKISFGEDGADYQLVCYDDSTLLKRLAMYPYIQLGVVLIFVIIAILALLSSKRAEQNKVWVGLSKETAHQLGTPISSLMAWVEILRETYPDDTLVPELNADVSRLKLIAERFSKIGSLPEPVDENMGVVIGHVIEYMRKRTSQQVEIVTNMPEHEVIVPLCAPLFEWVVENLCKNAVDAMEGKGRITITLTDDGGGVAVEVTDTGKGIRRKDIGRVFKPGFTTKARGWGLGLSLAKRIIDDYHHGAIFVKSSEVGVGTTFRIELKR